METTLVIFKDGREPVIISDEAIKKDFYCIDITELNPEIRRSTVDLSYSYESGTNGDALCKNLKKIIAGHPDLPAIDWNGLKDEFGFVDVEKLYYRFHPKGTDVAVTMWKEAFSVFKTYQQLNKKMFSLEDMERCFIAGQTYANTKSSPYPSIDFKGIIQSLQQPQFFPIEVEMECVGFETSTDALPLINKETNSIKIIRKS